MMIVKNAWRNIWRSKGRNILILLIVSIIAVASCVSLSIKNAAKTAEQSGLESLSITGTISVDRQSMMENVRNSGSDVKEAFSSMPDDLTLDQLEVYAGAEAVDSFTYSMSTSLSETDDFTAVSTDTESDDSTSSETTTGQNGMPGGGMSGGQSGFGGMGTEGDFTLVGYGSYTAMTDFVDGVSSITDGSIFSLDSADNTCIINTELATYNDVSVGDTITLLNPNDEDESITLTVCGIYETTADASTSGGLSFSSANDAANQIYANYQTVSSLVSTSEASATTTTNSTTGMTETTALTSSVDGVYHFADVEHYEAFEEQARALGLSDDYTVSSTDVDSYEQSILPLTNLSSFAGTLLWIVLGVGGVILIAFNLFNIRERKFEVGVLTAIGMKKPKVAMQFVCELFMVTLIGICIGTVIGSVVSVPASNAMLSLQTSSQETQQSKISDNFGMGGQQLNTDGTGFSGGTTSGSAPVMESGSGGFSGFMNSSVSTISEINAAVNFSVLWQLLLVGIGLTIISSLVAVIFVLRYEPLKILSERN